jgi:DNA polymerase-3 subunit gamma/tau
MEAPYTALARRFRPQTFAEVVGQGRIATTLRNAILDGRVAHAYLFTGARGVGKTSMARIFAKALNCPHAVDAVPCNACEICLSIAAGQDVDVSEIDGASNRRIDDIRLLRSNVNVRSMRSKYKVYIVDEVHMLTNEAFNALLKTLEEPPPGVKFIFCTTDPNKVPDTILSRCQRFDFGTVATQEIMGRLAEIATAEGYRVEPAALELVARRAAGSMRDSQSLFDQLLAFGSETIVAADVHRLLGTAPDDRLIGIVQALLDRDGAAALQQLEDSLGAGVQLEPFWDQLVNYFRDLMVTAAGGASLTLLSIGEDQRAQVEEQAKCWGLQTILAALDILAETRQRMQRSMLGRAMAELALVRVSLLRDLERIEQVIRELKGQAVPLPRREGSPQPRSLPAPTPPAPASPGPTPEKKTAELAASPETSEEGWQGPPPGDLEEEPPDAEASVGPVIEWGEGAGPAILAALQDRFHDITGTHLRQATSAAISGPNQLELSFPISYDLCRRGCERPEVLASLESTVQDLTGRPVRIRFRMVEGQPAPVRVTAPPPSTNPRTRTVEDPTDPLVAAVGKVFGVETWRVQELGPVAPVTDADDALAAESDP